MNLNCAALTPSASIFPVLTSAYVVQDSQGLARKGAQEYINRVKKTVSAPQIRNVSANGVSVCRHSFRSETPVNTRVIGINAVRTLNALWVPMAPNADVNLAVLEMPILDVMI